MLIPQQAESASGRRHGSPSGSLAELRRRLAEPSTLSDGQRQRLLELTTRLARVRALGDEYSRVDLSDYAKAALEPGAAVA